MRATEATEHAKATAKTDLRVVGLNTSFRLCGESKEDEPLFAEQCSGVCVVAHSAMCERRGSGVYILLRYTTRTRTESEPYFYSPRPDEELCLLVVVLLVLVLG